jgi:glycine dehydrogenase subunit 1
MAVRANRKSKSLHLLLSAGVSPTYQKVATAIAGTQGLGFSRLPLDMKTGATDLSALAGSGTPVAVVIQQPSYLGTYEDADALTNWAHENGALVIAICNPTSLALLRAPGHWGDAGADIACGEGQPLGVPLSSGGPYFGFMACKENIVRQMPGRIVGRTTDSEGKPGFTLTLQAREQHIRRSKATSNICTNQGLMVTAATIYMSLLGFEGLRRVALRSQQQTARLVSLLTDIPGVRKAFDAPGFHEAVIQLDRPVAPVLAALAERSVLGGLDLGNEFPQLDNAMLVCATETKTDEDLAVYADALRDILTTHKA